MIPSQPINFNDDLRMFGVRLLVVVLFIGIINISQSIEFKNIFGSWFSSNSAPKGRLLTPEEGCGLTKVTNTKIIGGSFAKPGKSLRSIRIDYKMSMIDGQLLKSNR